MDPASELVQTGGAALPAFGHQSFVSHGATGTELGDAGGTGGVWKAQRDVPKESVLRNTCVKRCRPSVHCRVQWGSCQTLPRMIYDAPSAHFELWLLLLFSRI